MGQSRSIAWTIIRDPGMVDRKSRLWQLLSPTLPVGAFHYSQGLEQAVEGGSVQSETEVYDWIVGVLRHAVSRVDLPIVIRCFRAWVARDACALEWWNELAVACRETRELREEDRAMGAAIGRLCRELGDDFPALQLAYPAAFGVTAVNWHICEADAVSGYAWSWAENQMLAAIRLMALGQTAGQRLMRRFSDDIEHAARIALTVSDDDIGMSAPGFALASALHETQYSRLFRS